LAALSPDGKFIALSDRSTKVVRVRSTTDMRPFRLDTLSGVAPVALTTFSRDGEKLTTAKEDGQLTLIDAAAQQD
jgi:hypothetical protein